MNYIFSVINCDCPENYQIGMQDPATPMMEGMLFFHNLLMFFVLFVGVFVINILYYTIKTFSISNNSKAEIFNHDSLLEIIWTILPAFILLFIATPSFTLLYSLDELVNPQLTVKIIGHQWYWSYEISDFTSNSAIGNIEFDSYMMPTEDLISTDFAGFRLLVSRPELILPNKTHIRLLITSADVIHSWAIPSFGIKVDACPGRLSQASLYINRPILNNKSNLFFGQCSEICGVNHGFMPITVRVLTPNQYLEIIGD
jgi:cytochrome c oxidase subunit 2